MRGRRKLHHEELHNLYSSPSIIRIIRARNMRWTRLTLLSPLERANLNHWTTHASVTTAV
jgi:hypothetical protein